jgi:putative ABC transport system permease protein
MFDLNEAVREWVRRLRRNKTMEEADLAEMESHLRDEVDRQMEAGLEAEAAFRAAAAQSAPPDELGREYGKFLFHKKHYPFWHPARFMPALAWNYAKVAARKIKRYKGYSVINIAGLSLGILCSLTILFLGLYELSYDRHYEKAKDLYRVVTQWPTVFMNTDKITWTSMLLAPALKAQFPDAAAASRVEDKPGGISLSHGIRVFAEERFYFVDPDFLSMFSITMLQGQRETALNNPLSVILSEDAAAKYFPGENPLGKILRYNDKHDFQVTGVFRNVPKNTHIRYDVLASFQSLPILEGENAVYMNSWRSLDYQTYIQLKEGADPLAFGKIMEAYLLKITPREMKDYRYFLQPVAKIHLGGNIPGELAQNSQMKYIYIYAGIAVLIILITCFNYINLSTARFSTRVSEMVLRKIIGANRGQLMRQFAGETLLITAIALVFALLLLMAAFPHLKTLTGIDLDLSLFKRADVLIGALALVGLIGFLSAYYPALYVSSRKSFRSVKPGAAQGFRRPETSRNLLAVVQFVISTALIVAALTVRRQVKFILDENLGRINDPIVTLRVNDDNAGLRKNIDVFKQELKNDPAVEAVAASSWLPTNIRSGNPANWEGQKKDETILFHNLRVDYDFLDLYGIPVVRGRNFSRSFPSDMTQAYLVNETAVRAMNMEDPIGKRFGYRGPEGVIIGVIKDFHFVPMHQRIQPLAVRLNLQSQIFLSIKIRSQNLARAIRTIKDKWQTLSPGFAFTYSFFDDDVAALYRPEQQLSRSVAFFTYMALILANLGLFGLTLFSVERRVKEIGIRKVCGARAFNIIFLISKDFFKWVLFANVLALPLAYWTVGKWLRSFAYRIDIGPGIFLLASFVSIATAGLTIVVRAHKAALANPVNSLRYE